MAPKKIVFNAKWTKFIHVQFTKCPVPIEMCFSLSLMSADIWRMRLLLCLQWIKSKWSHRKTADIRRGGEFYMAFNCIRIFHGIALCAYSEFNCWSQCLLVFFFFFGQNSFILLLFSFIYFCFARLKTSHYSSHGNCAVKKTRSEAVWAVQDTAMMVCVHIQWTGIHMEYGYA